MFGYIKAGAAVPSVKTADCEYNCMNMLECMERAAAQNVKLLVFPELSVSGYTCGDLFFQPLLISSCEKQIALLTEKSRDYDIVSIAGAPVLVNGGVYNCAVVIHAGEILGIVPKSVLSERGQFNEKRWFKPGSECTERTVFYCGRDVPFGKLIFKCRNYAHFIFAAEICADLWSIAPPSSIYSIMGATVIANLSASPDYAGKSLKRIEMLKTHSERCICAYVYSSCSIGESSADTVYDGQAIISELGEITAEAVRYSPKNEITVADADLESIVYTRAKSSEFTGNCDSGVQTIEFSFKEDDSVYPDIVLPKYPYLPKTGLDSFYSDIFNIQTYGLYKRLSHTGIKTSVIGVSGGLDSTLALLVTVNCHDKLELPRKNILGITMPGFGTSTETYRNAVGLMKELGVSIREISIADACIQHFKDIGHPIEKRDTTYENSQARERTQILMDVANAENGLVIGTGDMSELALGWATYNGDHMSMYGVNAGVLKTVIRRLISYLAESGMFGKEVSKILYGVAETPVSPELLPADENGNIAQKTEDLVGPYELHDYFIYCAVHKGYSPEKTAWLACRSFESVYGKQTVYKWLDVFYRRFFTQQFKRSCSPDSPKTLEFGLSQRTDLKIPSDASGKLWRIENPHA